MYISNRSKLFRAFSQKSIKSQPFFLNVILLEGVKVNLFFFLGKKRAYGCQKKYSFKTCLIGHVIYVQTHISVMINRMSYFMITRNIKDCNPLNVKNTYNINVTENMKPLGEICMRERALYIFRENSQVGKVPMPCNCINTHVTSIRPENS